MEIKKRIISLDIGTKRIGVAVCDALYITVTPLKTIPRNEKSIEIIKEICKEYSTDTILMGIPYNMDGTLGYQAKNCLDFIKPLKTSYNIIEHDERLSSFAAEDILKQKGKKYTKNKGLVDSTAAAVILQDYLDSLK